MPTSTASVRSATTVSVKVVSQTAMSARVSLSRSGISCHSPMFHATTNRIAASTASGMWEASGAANSSTISSVSA